MVGEMEDRGNPGLSGFDAKRPNGAADVIDPGGKGLRTVQSVARSKGFTKGIEGGPTNAV